MKKTVLILTAIACIGTVTLNSCKKSSSDDTSSTPPPTTTPTMSLYTRVGGTTSVQDPKAATGVMIEKGRLTLRSVVDSAIYVIAGDSKMAPFFPVLLGEVGSGNTTGFSALSKNFTDFLAVATGSKTTTYGGKSMKDAHDPAKNSRMALKATGQDFDRFIGDIGASLNKNGVATGTSLYNDLAALLYTTESDVVQISLYERVGGTAMVSDPKGGTIEQGRLTLRSVVDSAIYVIAGDAQMAPFFPVLLGEVGSGNTTGFNALSKNFTDFLAVATGSKTTTYMGKSMKDAHDPAKNSRMALKAGSADFDKFIGDIGTALGKNGVTDQRLIGDLVDLLYTTEGDVVQK